ncbi:cell division protein ZapC [Aeromonas diversa]|uniref:cell division protein ZapC n=1 Tax=Aeromonas diversa TaxID=502790 RepID=UPI0034631A56
MIIAPNDHWHWHYDHQADRLMLDLSEQMLFATEYCGKQLVPAAFNHAPFCVDDAALYYHLMECTQELNWSAPHQVQLVLNAIAVTRFYKPLMPQSWFFSELAGYMPEAGELVEMVTAHASGEFLVIEAGEQASVCLCLSDDLVLTTSKSLPHFGVIKVMNNRMRRRHRQPQSYLQAG